MHWEKIFGTATMIATIAMVFIGIPAQFIKNRREQRSGVPLSAAILSVFVFLLRICYSITISSYYLLIPDLFGIVLAVAILWQCWHYRNS